MIFVILSIPACHLNKLKLLHVHSHSSFENRQVFAEKGSLLLFFVTCRLIPTKFFVVKYRGFQWCSNQLIKMLRVSNQHKTIINTVISASDHKMPWTLNLAPNKKQKLVGYRWFSVVRCKKTGKEKRIADASFNFPENDILSNGLVNGVTVHRQEDIFVKNILLFFVWNC